MPFMEQEGSLSCSQEPATGHILSQINSVYNFPAYFSKIHSNNILPFILRSPKWSLPFRFSDQNVVCIHRKNVYLFGGLQ